MSDAPRSKAAESNAAAWGLPKVLDFFSERRRGLAELYPSERFFLDGCLNEGVRVLDIGCAQGGLAAALAERLGRFQYTGVDVNADMVERARARYPGHRFLHVREGDYSVLGAETFDLVVVFGILHLHETWRDTLAAAWCHTGGTLLFDLRETEGPTVEDKARSYFRMDFNGGDAIHADARLPYILVNAGDALGTVRRICAGARGLARYGYLHPVSDAAIGPVAEAMASVFRVDR